MSTFEKTPSEKGIIADVCGGRWNADFRPAHVLHEAGCPPDYSIVSQPGDLHRLVLHDDSGVVSPDNVGGVKGVSFINESRDAMRRHLLAVTNSLHPEAEFFEQIIRELNGRAEGSGENKIVRITADLERMADIEAFIRGVPGLVASYTINPVWPRINDVLEGDDPIISRSVSSGGDGGIDCDAGRIMRVVCYEGGYIDIKVLEMLHRLHFKIQSVTRKRRNDGKMAEMVIVIEKCGTPSYGRAYNNVHFINGVAKTEYREPSDAFQYVQTVVEDKGVAREVVKGSPLVCRDYTWPELKPVLRGSVPVGKSARLQRDLAVTDAPHIPNGVMLRGGAHGVDNSSAEQFEANFCDAFEGYMHRMRQSLLRHVSRSEA